MYRIAYVLRFYISTCMACTLLGLCFAGGINWALYIELLIVAFIFAPLYTFLILLLHLLNLNRTIIKSIKRTIVYASCPWIMLSIYGFIINHIPIDAQAFKEYSAPWYRDSTIITSCIFFLCCIIGVLEIKVSKFHNQSSTHHQSMGDNPSDTP